MASTRRLPQRRSGLLRETCPRRCPERTAPPYPRHRPQESSHHATSERLDGIQGPDLNKKNSNMAVSVFFEILGFAPITQDMSLEGFGVDTRKEEWKQDNIDDRHICAGMWGPDADSDVEPVGLVE